MPSKVATQDSELSYARSPRFVAQSPLTLTLARALTVVRCADSGLDHRQRHLRAPIALYCRRETHIAAPIWLANRHMFHPTRQTPAWSPSIGAKKRSKDLGRVR